MGVLCEQVVPEESDKMPWKGKQGLYSQVAISGKMVQYDFSFFTLALFNTTQSHCVLLSGCKQLSPANSGSSTVTVSLFQLVLQLCCRVLTEGQVKPRAGYIKGGWCQDPSVVTQSKFKHKLVLPQPPGALLPLQPQLSTFKAAQDRIKSLAPGSKSRY